jgi:hypothetical protein
MIVRAAVVALALLCPAIGSAQSGSTREQVDRAIAMYEAFNVESARPILLNIISPSYLQPVSPTERVDAYKFLGASYALLDKRDSAVSFFVAALDFDPFTDLDPRVFSASEIAAFNDAKTQIFKVAIRRVADFVIDPKRDSTAYNFSLITTHRGSLLVELINQRDTTQRETLYEGESDGARRIPWNGVLRNGQYADTAIYQLRARATSLRRPGSQPISDAQYFRVEHAFEPLEDTLPAFGAGDTLVTQIPARAPWNDLIKGGSMAVAAIALPLIALNSDVKGWTTHAGVAAGVGLGAATISFAYRRQNRAIPANVAENARRMQQRGAFNAGVRARNQTRLDARKIVLLGLAGLSR